MASGGAVAWTWGCAHVQADGDTLTQELVQMSWALEPLAMASRCTGQARHAAWAQASPASADRPRHPREPTPWEGPGCGLAGRVAGCRPWENGFWGTSWVSCHHCYCKAHDLGRSRDSLCLVPQCDMGTVLAPSTWAVPGVKVLT